MSAPPIDGILLRFAPAPPTPVDPGLLRARDSIRRGLVDLAAVPEEALARPWLGDEEELRYGFYSHLQRLEDARALIRPLLGGARAHETPARPLVGAATAARWDIHGLLAGLSDGELDTDPGNNEWTLRQTLGHIVGGQRQYGVFTAWWLGQRGAPADDFPVGAPMELDAELPTEEVEGQGSVDDIRRRLDETVDQSAAVFASLGAEDLAVRARWSGLPVDIRFRVIRWTSHMREHTVQLEKTLVFIGRPTTEVERLLRLVATAYGRLEEELFMWPATDQSVGDAIALAEATAAEIAADAERVRAAATD